MARFQLSTKRAILSPVAPEDAVTLHQLWTKQKVRRYLWDDQIIPEEQTREIISISEKQFQTEQSGLWLMRKPKDKALIGFCGLWYFFDEPQPQLLFGLDPACFGYGFATEGASCIIDYAFNNLKFSYLIASCDAPHIASIKVMERLGMTKESESVKDGLYTFFYKLESTCS
ncbi:MAG: GNAT family N-acetyltransferase [Cyclobacteriaceae bacterium]